MSSVRKVKIHYRRAKLNGTAKDRVPLQERLTAAVGAAIGRDARERVLAMDPDGEHHACLHYSQPAPQAFFADVMHLDGRRSVPTWIDPTTPQPLATIISQPVGEGRRSLGEPLYIMVQGNHVAAIERMGFRAAQLSFYLNALLQKASQLETDTNWILVPKIELTGGNGLSGGVKKVIVQPAAAMAGTGPSRVANDDGARKARKISSRLEDLFAAGAQVFDLLRVMGADEAKLQDLRAAMSEDLMLKATLQLSVARYRKGTLAELSPELVQQALAELAEYGNVTVQAEGGKSDGKLVQLVHTADVLEEGGLIDWQHAIQALSSAMSAWAAKGSIDVAAEWD